MADTQMNLDRLVCAARRNLAANRNVITYAWREGNLQDAVNYNYVNCIMPRTR